MGLPETEKTTWKIPEPQPFTAPITPEREPEQVPVRVAPERQPELVPA